jgi:hypothetical protein
MLMIDGPSNAVFAACDWCDKPVLQERDWMVWPEGRTAQARVAMLHEECIMSYAAVMYRTQGLAGQQVTYLKCRGWRMQVGVLDNKDIIRVTVKVGPQKMGAA